LVGVPTSLRTERFARARGLPLTTLEEPLDIDLTVDGADEVDPQLNALKGGGGAHTREKIVASASREYWLIVDESKLVEHLGEKHPVPVEVLPFGWKLVQRELEKLGAEPALRRLPDEKPFLTDDGHYVLDARFPGGLQDPDAIARAIKALPGVIEHGLFLSMADRVIVASQKTGVRVLERE
jgi:ribose 5-phosphate isomerase A